MAAKKAKKVERKQVIYYCVGRCGTIVARPNTHCAKCAALYRAHNRERNH